MPEKTRSATARGAKALECVGGGIAMDSSKASFESAHPRGFFVDIGAPEALCDYARKHGWLHPSEPLLSVSKAGEGNMNLTLRLETPERSFILKQARPWVEKYPAIAAPAARALVEAAFYRTVSSRSALQTAMPALLGEDPDSGLLVLEDLRNARDFTGLYRGERLSERDLESLISFLVELHRPFEERDPIFQNREMRALNHEHIFRLPLARENGIDLDRITPGLGAAARALQDDEGYAARVRELGALYLEDRASLVHGDYFPGSWLRTAGGIRVIDPEFCFQGHAAFDLGVLCAHMYFSRQPERAERAIEIYGGGAAFNETAKGFAGAEVMRRLIGVAQLPLEASLEEKQELLALSKRLV
jgi:5-methylthioribose kinase